MGRELPEQILVDQHCLVESFRTGTGGTFTRQRDYITVRLESIKGPGNAWVDYEVPGIGPRQQGPRGQFDPASPAVALPFQSTSRLPAVPVSYMPAQTTTSGRTGTSRSPLLRCAARPRVTVRTLSCRTAFGARTSKCN